MSDGLGRYRTVLVLGGGSDIGLATAKRLVGGGTKNVILAARRPDSLISSADELRARGAEDVELADFDALDLPSHASFVADLFERNRDIDLVLLTFGVLPDEAAAKKDPSIAIEAARTNYVGAVSLLLPIAARMVTQGHGTIVVLSSVAAERGRRSNFVYGSSKAGLDTFCQGLADELHRSGVRLLVVRPGFVRSSMTRGETNSVAGIDRRRRIGSAMSVNERWPSSNVTWQALLKRREPLTSPITSSRLTKR